MRNLIDWIKAIGLVVIIIALLYTVWVTVIFLAIIISIITAKFLLGEYYLVDDGS